MKKIFAWISLIILFIAVLILLYALLTANGKLAMACIFSLIFISILLYIVLNIYSKRQNKYKK